MGRKYKTPPKKFTPLRSAITDYCWLHRIDIEDFAKKLGLTRQTVYNAGANPFRVKRQVLESICDTLFGNNKLAKDLMLLQSGVMPNDLAKEIGKDPGLFKEFFKNLAPYQKMPEPELPHIPTEAFTPGLA